MGRTTGDGPAGDGWRAPKRYDVSIGLAITSDMRAWLERRCRTAGVSLSRYVRRVLDAHREEVDQ